MMILSLTEGTNNDWTALSRLVGGKAASLMRLFTIQGSSHVPKGFALTVDFFSDWMDAIRKSNEWKQAVSDPNLESCNIVKEHARQLQLSADQSTVLEQLKKNVNSWSLPCAAVRSSAPEEDGSTTSFAGVFETKLGVPPESLEEAVRECFASRFDYRVLSYTDQATRNQSFAAPDATSGFACVVMEMVDSQVAGVAFSVNPLNSDLDEMVIDSSWGLGESVVDGSVEVDHYVFNKVENCVIEKRIGSKTQEKRLSESGGVKS